MRRHSILFAVLGGCAVSAAQAADPLSSSYWEAAYLNATYENSLSPADDEVEGFRAAASVGLGRYVNAVVDYDQRRYQDDRDAFGAVGLGLHTADPAYQFFGHATWERWEQDSNTNPSSDRDEEGYGVEVGARYAFTHVALQAAYKYLDFGEVEGDDVTGARYGAGAALSLSPWWALTADYRIRELDYETGTSSESEEYTEWSVGFRRYFPTAADPRKRKDGVLFGTE